MPLLSGRVDQVDVDTLERRLQGGNAFVLDVREPEEYAGGHVPGAVNLPQAEIATRLEEVPRDRVVFAVCQGGFRSRRAAQFLRQAGYERVINVEGGTAEWIDAGKPVAVDDPAAQSRIFARSQWTHAGVQPSAA
jgi:rhodanese-related sulfurtransferase